MYAHACVHIIVYSTLEAARMPGYPSIGEYGNISVACSFCLYCSMQILQLFVWLFCFLENVRYQYLLQRSNFSSFMKFVQLTHFTFITLCKILG